MQTGRLAVLAAVLASVVGLPPIAAQTTGISDDVVKIGVLTDMSGEYAGESGEGSITAVRMAIDDFGGKVLGKPIELVYADHKNDPDLAATIARKWFEVDKVDLIANLITSSVALRITQLAKDENKIAIVNGAGSSALTNTACTPNSIHYNYDTYALSKSIATALIKSGGTSWYFLTANYAFAHGIETETATLVKALGGQVLGSTEYPAEASDQSSYLQKAQDSHAKVIALAATGSPAAGEMKAALAAGMPKDGQTLAGIVIRITDIKKFGLEATQGLVFTEGFYWDRDEETRAWSKRFFEKMKRMPHMGDAGDYSSTMHYLKAIEAAGTDDAKTVMAKMREMPINDFFAKNGRIREDGQMLHDMYVFQVKKPSESKGDWDFYKLRTVVPGDEAFRSPKDSSCPLLKNG